MDLKDQLKQIADKIGKIKEYTQTEEATKMYYLFDRSREVYNF